MSGSSTHIDERLLRRWRTRLDPMATDADVRAGIEAAVQSGEVEELHGVVGPFAWHGQVDKRPLDQRLDPKVRRALGAWYTPEPLVRGVVGFVDELLREHLQTEGLASPTVSILDPATGTGAFPLAIVDHVAQRTETPNRQQVARRLQRTLQGVEVLPGAHTLAWLRCRRALMTLGGESLDPRMVRGDGLAATPPDCEVAVVIGNPPWRRVEQSQAPGIEDLVAAAGRQTIFSHIASLYNLYVVFWRHALRVAFEEREGPAVAAFVTPGSWLRGPGFVGLREKMRAVGGTLWVCELGRGLFPVETPVSVSVLMRGPSRRSAIVHHRRLRGSTSQRMEAVASLTVGGEWSVVASGPGAPVVRAAQGERWGEMSPLIDVFPWRHPGCKYGRTWPIAPSPEILAARWAHFCEATPADRPRLFQTARTGRTVHSRVGGRVPLFDLKADAPLPPVVPYGYRSFDRQYALADPRLCALERPPLWRAHSDRQRYLTGPLTRTPGPGPCLTVTSQIPDLHHFRGSWGGKDVIPQYADASCLRPNVADGLCERFGCPPEDLFAYVYALLSAPAYERRFRAVLEVPGLRIPMTADSDLRDHAVSLGKRLLTVHLDPGRVDLGQVTWKRHVSEGVRDRRDVRWSDGCLYVGDGLLSGVPESVWSYKVSGMRVVPKWIGYRTRTGAGRSATSGSALDRIRDEGWRDSWSLELLQLVALLSFTVGLWPEQESVLDEICSGPLLGVV